MKAAVIGAGAMGQRHVRALQGLGLEIVGLCDRRQESLAKVQAELGVAPTALFTDAETLLRQTSPACVVVATTADSHCALTCLAAENGARYILCEKPMAVSLEQCDRMLETCRRHGTKLAINHPHRFIAQYTELRRLTHTEEFGELSSVTIVAGNVGLAMNASHFLEMFRFLTDEEQFEVTAWLDAERVPNPRGEQFQDAAGCVRALTPRGKRLYIDIGAAQGHGFKIVCAGRYGQLAFDVLAGSLQLSVRQPDQRELPSTRYAAPHDDTVINVGPTDAVAASRGALAALLAEADYPTGEQGRLVVRNLVAAYVSHEGGQVPVRWADPLPNERVFPWA